MAPPYEELRATPSDLSSFAGSTEGIGYCGFSNIGTSYYLLHENAPVSTGSLRLYMLAAVSLLRYGSKALMGPRIASPLASIECGVYCGLRAGPVSQNIWSCAIQANLSQPLFPR
jgi:hypothetical protein